MEKASDSRTVSNMKTFDKKIEVLFADLYHVLYIQKSLISCHGFIFCCHFQLIGLQECLKRIHDMITEAKQNANLDQAVKLKALVCI